jgi:HlyD family secretion protein
MRGAPGLQHWPAIAASLLVSAGATIATGNASAETTQSPGTVAALGRLEPEHGVIRVSAPGPIGMATVLVLKELLVDEGDDVIEGQLLAVSDMVDFKKAIVEEAKAQLEFTRREAAAVSAGAEEACTLADVRGREAQRREGLRLNNLASEEEVERAEGDAAALRASCRAAQAAAQAAGSRIELMQAGLRRAETDLERSYVRAPMPGRILEIISRPGEAITSRGVLDIGRVDRMYAIAEVYETDVRRLRIGQGATVSSSALASPMSGTIDRIRLKVQQMNETGTDQASLKDARIVEVEVRLDESAPVAGLTYLQVRVVFEP